MIRIIINFLKRILGFEVLAREDSAPFSGLAWYKIQQNYWQHLTDDGTWSIPTLKGLVENEYYYVEFCKRKSTKEIEKLFESCTDPAEIRLYWRILNERYQKEVNKFKTQY